MAKKVLTEAAIAKLKRKGASVKVVPKPKVLAKAINTAESSPTMIAAIQAAEAAVSAANAAKDLTVNMVNDNKIFLTDMVQVMKGNQITQLKVNRNKKDVLTTVDIIRGAN